MFKINNRKISRNNLPYLVAEMSSNHCQNFSIAKKIIKSAKTIGIDAIKIQYYEPDTITLNHRSKDFKIRDKNSLWKNYYLYDLYNKSYTNKKLVKDIFAICKDLNMTCFASVFDESGVDFLDSLNTPAFKIASFENTHIPLLKKVAQTKKPIIISAGIISDSELEESINCIVGEGNQKIAILKCTSYYPANYEDLNLNAIKYLKDKFPKFEIGYSDHSLGISASIASVALGATIIEKHFTLSKTKKTLDGKFSADKNEMYQIRSEIDNCHQSIGLNKLIMSKNEKKSLNFKRSIYVKENIKKGQIFTKNNLIVVRPGYSIKPKFYETLLGQKSKFSYSKGDRLKEKELS